jgi:hypothetical protein
LDSLPLSGEFDGVGFNIVFWCQKFVGLMIVKITTETGDGSLEFGWSSDVDTVFLVPENSQTIVKGDLVEKRCNFFNNKSVSMIWKGCNRFRCVQRTSSNELAIFTVNTEDDRSTTSGTRTIMILDENFPGEFTISSGQNVSTFAMEVEGNTVEGSVVSGQRSTDSIALVVGTLPATVDTDALVAITSDTGSWGVFISSKLTWTLTSLDTFSVVEVSSGWTVTTIDTVVIVAVV